MESVFLSIIVPVYNAAAYLPECLDSLLMQDIPQSDYEIICINDGSKDDSLSILRTYADQHPNIVIIDKENGGVTTARNAGLAAARGEYIWFVDSDDFLKHQIFGKLQSLIHQHNCDRLVIGCYIFDDVLSPEEKQLSDLCQLPLNGPGRDSICVRSLFRRSFLESRSLFFSHPELTHGEDGMFMYEVVRHSPSQFVLEEAIYFYRIHSGSAETTDSVASLLKKFRSYLRIAELLKEYYESGAKDYKTANTYMTFLWFALFTSASLPFREARKTLKALKAAGLYPGMILSECTLSESYMTDTSTLPGKLYDKVCMHLHRPWGYAAMFLIRMLLRLKRRLLH